MTAGKKAKSDIRKTDTRPRKPIIAEEHAAWSRSAKVTQGTNAAPKASPAELTLVEVQGRLKEAWRAVAKSGEGGSSKQKTAVAGPSAAPTEPSSAASGGIPCPGGSLAIEMAGLSSQKETLLDELEIAYEGLAQALEISRRETDVAYAELRNKISVLERKVFELISLNNIGKAITSELKLDNLLEVILTKICELIEVDAAVLALTNRREELEIKLVRGLPKSFLGSAFALDVEVAYRAAVNHDEPVVIQDMDASSRLSVFKLDPRMVSAVLIPLKTHKEKVGLLVLNSTERHSFNHEHVLLLSTFGAQAAIAIVNAKLYANLKSMLLGVVASLSTALEAKDPYTEGHSTRVAEYAVVIGRQIGMNQSALEELRNAGLIHDIGKIGVPESVICKQGKLDSDEWQQMRLHPQHGENIASPVPFLEPVVPGVKSHHERYDGQGYPEGIAQEKIPLMARILAVADTFDAITSRRSYREARSPQEALKEIRAHSGAQFDPKIVEALEDAFDDILRAAGNKFREPSAVTTVGSPAHSGSRGGASRS